MAEAKPGGGLTQYPSFRIDGLDTWRALLMLLGVALHASLWTRYRTFYVAIDLVSGSFRMGAFFIISGLLAGMTLQRRTPPLWLRRRLLIIGIPAAFGLGVICPMIGMLALRLSPNGRPFHPLMLDWYHLWFLVALLVYAVRAWTVEEADRRTGLFSRIEGWASSRRAVQERVLLQVGLISFLLMLCATVVLSRFLPARYDSSLVAESRLIVGYAPDYLLGFALARSYSLRTKMLNGVAIPTVMVAVLAVVAVLCYRSFVWGGPDGSNLPMLRLGAAAFCPPAVAMLILRSAVAIRRVPPVLRSLSDASFTIYLLHMPIILLTAVWLDGRLLSTPSKFVVATVGSFFLSYAIHLGLVRRSRMAALLLNGRHDAPPGRPQREARACIE